MMKIIFKSVRGYLRNPQVIGKKEGKTKKECAIKIWEGSWLELIKLSKNKILKIQLI